MWVSQYYIISRAGRGAYLTRSTASNQEASCETTGHGATGKDSHLVCYTVALGSARGRDGASCSRGVSDCSTIRVSFADRPGPINVVFELGILTIRLYDTPDAARRRCEPRSHAAG